jgi:hypothetical protein
MEIGAFLGRASIAGFRTQARKAQSMTGIDAGDFSRSRNVDLRRFTIDQLMLIVNRLGSRIQVAVKFRQKSAGRHAPAGL